MTGFTIERVGQAYLRGFVRAWVRKQRVLLVLTGLAVTGALVSAVTGNAEPSRHIVRLSMFYLPMIAGLLTLSGIVSEDRDTNFMVLWFQKPGRIIPIYLKRYLVGLAALLVFAGIAMVLLGVLAIAIDVLTPTAMLRRAAVMLLVAVLAGSIVFAFSAWGTRRDGVLAFMVIFLSLLLAGAFAFDDTRFAAFTRAVAFPMDALGALSGGSAWNGSLPPIVFITLHIAAWNLVGLFGLLYTEWALARGRMGAGE